VAAHEQLRARGGRGVATALGEHARAARIKVIGDDNAVASAADRGGDGRRGGATVADGEALGLLRGFRAGRRAHAEARVAGRDAQHHYRDHGNGLLPHERAADRIRREPFRGRRRLGVVARRRARVVAAAARARARTRRRAGGERRVAQGELAAAELKRARKS